MQNNVTELTQKLLRSLDSNYNVIDMPTVVEIISTLEKIIITKELLETTRLGKHVNQLRRNTTNEPLAKRAKELVKRWRDMVLPDSNNGEKKRPAKDPLNNVVEPKRFRFNGAPNELDFSDNSNSSFKETRPPKVIVINSDSNSSMPEQAPVIEQPQPKKRGRKKGSKNHKNLLEEAETSFSNKLNVSRGNAKVKTTQELLADLHIRNTATTKEDLNERAAKLTERVSLIDRKLNASSNRYRRKNVVENPPVALPVTDDEIIVVDDVPEPVVEAPPPPVLAEPPEIKSLSVEEALKLLPPIDRTILNVPDPNPTCTCVLIERKSDSTSGDENVNSTYEFHSDPACPAADNLNSKYKVGDIAQRVESLHTERLPNINGNFGVGKRAPGDLPNEEGLYANVVPKYRDCIPKCFSEGSPASENFKKYSISEGETFREWHEVLEAPSYNGEILKILPYVIID